MSLRLCGAANLWGSPRCFQAVSLSPAEARHHFTQHCRTLGWSLGWGSCLTTCSQVRKGRMGLLQHPKAGGVVRAQRARCWRCTQQMLTRTWLESTQGTRQLSLAIPGSASEWGCLEGRSAPSRHAQANVCWKTRAEVEIAFWGAAAALPSLSVCSLGLNQFGLTRYDACVWGGQITKANKAQYCKNPWLSSNGGRCAGLCTFLILHSEYSEFVKFCFPVLNT